jgi:NAD(P)-dependent dehydrogenase (short-subunit alcohol dehydrogenase family)
MGGDRARDGPFLPRLAVAPARLKLWGMAKTIIVAGFGPGISSGVAEKFGKQGFAVALVARSGDRLAAGVKELETNGIRAKGFVADLSDPEAARGVVARVRAELGPVTVLHWNAYAGAAGDLLTADTAELRKLYDVPITSLLAAVQSALPDLRTQQDAAVLVTNGGLGLFDPAVDVMAVSWGVMGLGVANSAKHKLVRLLSAKLGTEGIFVGEVMVLGTVKGTPWDTGSATLEASAVADKFWEIYNERRPVAATIG